jgi:hypothetical protein
MRRARVRVRVRIIFIPPLLYEQPDTILLEQSAFMVTMSLVMKTNLRLHLKWPIFCSILIKLVFCLQFFITAPNIKLHGISPSASNADICGGTDGHGEGNKALFAILQMSQKWRLCRQ